MKKLYIILLLFSFTAWSQISTDEKKALEFNDYFFDAMNERLKNNYDKSNEYFEQCLVLDDKNDAIYFKIAQNYLDAKKYEEALQYLAQARRLNPDNKWYQKLYIDIKIDSGASRDEVKKMIVDFEPQAQNKYLINSLYRKMYRKTARVNYQKPEKKNITSPSGKLGVLWQKKDYQAVVKTGEKMLDEAPDNPRTYLYVAQAYMELNKPKQALEYLDMGKDFVLNDKKLQKAYYQLYITVYQKLNKPNKVKQYQRKLKKI